MDETTQNLVGEKMKRYRKLRNMSQEELSEASGINVSTIKKYECGFRNPKVDQLVKIANALDISINAFVSFEITTVSDVISLLMSMDEQTEMCWKGEKDAEGNYIPDSISISFENSMINNSLAAYMKYRDAKYNISENSTTSTDSNESSHLQVDYSLHGNDLGIVIENSKEHLLLSNDKIK